MNAAVAPRRSVRQLGTALPFLSPSLALFALFTFWPLVRTFALSFYGNDIIGRPTLFVGASQYQQLLSSPNLRGTLVATLLFALMTVVPGLLLGLGLALPLQAGLAGIGVFRTLLATPFAFSVATASVIFAILYNPGVGVFNGFPDHDKYSLADLEPNILGYYSIDNRLYSITGAPATRRSSMSTRPRTSRSSSGGPGWSPTAWRSTPAATRPTRRTRSRPAASR